MKVCKSHYFFGVLLSSLILSFTTTLLAHPHHETDIVGSLGLDHILYAMLIIAATFFFFGKISK